MVAPTLSLGESRAELVLGVLGFFTAFAVIISPSCTFKTIVSTRQVGATKPYPYLSVVFNSAIWVVFGLPLIIKLSHGHHPLVDWLSLPLMLANVVGVIVELVYVGIFIRYAAVGTRRWPVITLAVVLTVPVIVLGLLFGMKWSRTFVGYIAMFSGIAMYAIPVIGTYTAYKANDYTQISGLQAGASFINGAVWTAYSCIARVHAFVFVPNLVAVLCAGGQLIVRTWLKYRVPPQDLEDAEHPKDGGNSPRLSVDGGDGHEEDVVPRAVDEARVPGAGVDGRVSVGEAGGSSGVQIQMTEMQQRVADPVQQLAQGGGRVGPIEDLAEVGSEVLVLGGGNNQDEVKKQVGEKEGGGGHSSDDDDGGYNGGGGVITVEEHEEDKAEGGGSHSSVVPASI